ncbi:MAG: hypothetical protein ACI92E_000562 [Oceanicoccus sp.]|jgi:hypothetical protein
MSNTDAIDPGFDLANCRIPLRLAFVDSNEFPRIVSLWFQYTNDVFLCATHKDSWIVKQLKRSSKVGFEIASNSPPYQGVRGTGTVDIFPLSEGPLLEELVSRYLGDGESEFAHFLLKRKKDELVLQINPTKLSSWDYSNRMQGAIKPSLYS